MKQARLYSWNGKLQSIRDIAKHLNVTYLTAQGYLDRGFCCDKDVMQWRNNNPYTNHSTGKKQSRSKLPMPEYDNFIADMQSWGNPDETE